MIGYIILMDAYEQQNYLEKVCIHDGNDRL